ncbi:MAG TPA: rRNA maturation RNase YbeY [Ignavibacteriaceae bacterium]|nr:rRNA maturation RNase YbeY [Ignavibacteriaceae bacterium]
MVKNLSVNVLKNQNIDKKFIHKIVKELKKELEFNLTGIIINIISSEEIVRINKKYLNHNYSTDIITFNYSESEKLLDGEIFISVDDASVNAKKYKVNLKQEITRLVIHGFLHLLGYDDQSQKNKTVMKKLENQLYNRYRLLYR